MKKRLSIVLILTAILLTFLGINYMERKNYVPKEVPVDESEIGIQIDYMDDHINKQIAFATSKRIETRKLNHDGEVLKTALEDQAYDEIRLMEKERIEEERLEAERIAYEAWLAEQERIAEEERRIEEERRLEEQRRLEEEKRLEMLGLCCRAWAFSSCIELGLLLAVLGLLIVVASLVVEHGL